MSVDEASYKENNFQADYTKEMCFLLSNDQKRYSFLLQKLWDRKNVGMDEYPVTNKSSLDILIQTEGGIRGNHKLSTYENRGGREGCHHKELTVHTFTQ